MRGAESVCAEFCCERFGWLGAMENPSYHRGNARGNPMVVDRLGELP